MLNKAYGFTCELRLEYSLTRRPAIGTDGFPRMEAVPRCRTYARQMFDRFLLGGSDPFMYRLQDLWLDLYQAPWAIPQEKEQLLNDLSAKVASGELFIYRETDLSSLGPGHYERSGPGAPPEPPEDAPRTSSTSETHSASMGAAPAAGLPVADSDGVNAGSAVGGEGVVPDNESNTIRLDSRTNFRAESKNPQPNTVYEFDGFTYKTDNLGRGVSSSGELRLGAGGNRFHDDRLIGHKGEKDDIAFHAGADEFGFQGGQLNLSPGNKKLNNKEYRALERELKSELQAGRKVEADFQTVYNPGNSTSRPDKYTVDYRVDDGRWRTRTFFNREGG